MNGLFTLRFWKDAVERMVKTAAQSILLAWGGGDLIGDLFALDWQIALGAAGGGAILSLLTSLISIGAGDGGTASLVSAEPRGKHLA